jgi:DNA-directed DNA polymerase III PolC
LVDERGFSVVDVGDDRNVANVGGEIRHKSKGAPHCRLAGGWEAQKWRDGATARQRDKYGAADGRLTNGQKGEQLFTVKTGEIVAALGNYSAYSFGEAVWPVAALVAAAQAAGYTAVGLADTGAVRGLVALSQACGHCGMQGVFGVRLEVEHLGCVQLTLRDSDGYAAVCRLLTNCGGGARLGWGDWCRWQRDAGAHWWVSLAVPGTQVRPGGRVSVYQQWLGLWARCAAEGWTNLWVELGWHNPAQRLLQRRVFGELSAAGWRNWVAVTAARHPATADAGQRMAVLQAVHTLTRVDEPHPDKLAPGDYGLPDRAELAARFERAPAVAAGTARFVAGCAFDFQFGRLHLPRNGGAAGGDVNRRLAWVCARGAVRRYRRAAYPFGEPPTRAAVGARLARELAIVGETGFAGYFLVFHEIVSECARRGIAVLARGSAAGSLICYTLGVANVCPFRFGLSFERFLNPERLRHSKLPDIDLDLPWDRREAIIDWVHQRFGAEHVAMIGGCSTWQGRAAVADVARALGVTATEAASLTRHLPWGSVRRMVQDVGRLPEADVTRRHPLFERIVGLAGALDGLPRHPMMHPCGIVVADQPLWQFTATEPGSRGFPMTQLDMDAIEDLGLLKLDLLGQAGLSVVRDCVANVVADAACGRPTDDAVWQGFQLDDPAVFAMMRDGGARGVFHIESPAMTQLLALCGCDSLDCVVACVSVIRPGAANEHKKTAFAKRHLGMEPVTYAHPVLADVLADTYGLLVYEEHILWVAHRFAGMDWGRADLLRRILIRKREDNELAMLEGLFRAGARQLGRDEAAIDTVWSELRDFSGYMFNKAHGAAYAVEAYRACWLKQRWPIHYLAAVLNNRRGFYAPVVYLLEAVRHGAMPVLPDVQAAVDGFRAVGRELHFPLWQIRGLSDVLLERRRSARGVAPFDGWQDFVERVQPSTDDALLLAKAGALRAFFASRHAAAASVLQLETKGMRRQRAGVRQQLLDLAAGGAVVDVPVVADTAERLRAWERELLDWPVSVEAAAAGELPAGPVVACLLGGLDRSGTIPLAGVAAYCGATVWVAGLVVCSRLHRTRDGQPMKFVTLADASAMAEVVFFPDAYRVYAPMLASHAAIRVRVAVSRDTTGRGLSLAAMQHLTTSLNG